MKNLKNVVILCGGQSGERDVSFKSAEPVFEVLKQYYPTRLIRLDENALPGGLNPEEDLIFPLTHGDFGEDGQLQALLEAGGFSYMGSDSKTSALCMDKMRSKQLAQAHNLPVLPGIALKNGQKLDEAFICNTLKGTSFVLKPTDKGSSIGVHLCPDFKSLQDAWATISSGNWMIERYAQGRELTLGILQGEAMGVVEIRPKHGFYDFKNKYTSGACEYLYPAPIDSNIKEQIQAIGVAFFKYANCRDFGRIDCILEPDGHLWLLEMNTIPGMTGQSLFPKSAASIGLSFEDLLKQLVQKALQRC
ncbi:MAG: D-alanine--D-alanine ligase family protein [bacterium]